jgi:hypothetical protein
VTQDRPLIERYARQPDGNWLLTVFEDMSAVYSSSSVPVQIPLIEAYRGVMFARTSHE